MTATLPEDYQPLPCPTPISAQSWPPSTKPLVSICCQAYNHALFIRQCLESFLVQKTTFPVEILIHDDASTDDTVEIIQEYALRYPRLIKPVFQRRNQYSQGIKIMPAYQIPRAQGAFIAFCEGDDFWTADDKLQEQISFLLENPQYTHCWTRFETLCQESGLRSTDHNQHYFVSESKGIPVGFREFCYMGWHIGMQTLVFKKSAFNLANALSKRHYRDVFLISDLLLKGPGYCLSTVKAVYRIHPKGIYSRTSADERLVKAELIYREIAQTYPWHKPLCDKYKTRASQLISFYLNNNRFMLAFRAAFRQSVVTGEFAPIVFVYKTVLLKAIWKVANLPALRRLRFLLVRWHGDGEYYLRVFQLWIKSFIPVTWDDDSNIIISITSFPARIDHAWIAIESLFQQDLRPRKIVLVLCESEFPLRKLPRSIQRQQARGLEILWTNTNIGSFKKLLPTRSRYSNFYVATFDDDILYEPWRLAKLYKSSRTNPDAIIGHRGWVLTKAQGGFAPYVTWPPADSSTDSRLCFLTSGGGTLFPPHILSDELLLNAELALSLCPKADDIWFWAVARYSGVPLSCLGNNSLKEVKHLQRSPALWHSNRGQGDNDIQLRHVCDYFSRQLGISIA